MITMKTAISSGTTATKTQASHSARPRRKAHNHERDYNSLLRAIRRSFDSLKSKYSDFFMTDAAGLYDLFISKLPAEKQIHTCRACRKFIETYGALAVIDANGLLVSAMWNVIGGPDDDENYNVPEFYIPAIDAMQRRVTLARVTSVFHSTERRWGTAQTGIWAHMSVDPLFDNVYTERALTANQAMAANKENFNTVETALAVFTIPVLDNALRIFEAGAVRNSEKFVGPVKWLRDLQDRPKGRRGENLIWAAIARAPEGYCHPRSSVVGSLLEDLALGLPFGDIQTKFNAKMAPLLYKRPQAAPSAGNVRAAEVLVEKLGIAPSLERRCATLSDINDFVWAPKVRETSLSRGGGVFGHLKTKSMVPVTPVNLPPVTMTWEKFQRTVMPTADLIELRAPSTGRYIAITTALDFNAPPIIKWDSLEERNPLAWYVYPKGSTAERWGLVSSKWTKVTAITPFPPMHGSNPKPHLGEGFILILEGARDSRTGVRGNALFPDLLRDDLHSVRSTIEAYSQNATLHHDRNEPAACGYDIRKGAADCHLRSLSNGSWAEYRIDRWD
jgi:hypothetical protein